MANAVYWCPKCRVPIIKNSICPVCGSSCKPLSSSGVCNPVFLQEKRLLSIIIGRPLDDAEIWYLGNSYYLIDGERTRLPYVEFYKEKQYLKIAEDLRKDTVCDDLFPGRDRFISANLQHLESIVFEAEEYITDVVASLKSAPDSPENTRSLFHCPG